MQKIGKSLALSLLLSGFAATANESTGIIPYVHSCDELIDPKLPMVSFDPHFTQKNEPRGISLWSMRHKFGGFTTFSPDGQVVVVSHGIYPNGDQLSLRKLDSGNMVGTLVWTGSGDSFADLHSVAVNSESNRLVAHGFSGSQQPDQIVIWNYATNSIERVSIPAPQKSDYLPVQGNWSSSGLIANSQISAEHPYFLRMRYLPANSVGGGPQFLNQLIDWKTGRMLQLTDTHPILHKYLQDNNVVNSNYRFVAIPTADLKTVNVTSFAQLEKQMGAVSNSPKLSSPTLLSRLLPSRLRANAPAPILREDFATPLVHSIPIKKMVVLSWAPLVITQTEAGLTVWNAKTGENIAEIPEAKWDFRALERMGVIAYVLPDKKVAFYSIFERKTLATLANFSNFLIRYSIDHWQDGIAFVRDDNGRIFKISEQKGEYEFNYDFSDTGLVTEIPLNKVERTVIQTPKDSYFLVISSQSRLRITPETPMNTPLEVPENQNGSDLIIQIYSLSKKELVGEKKYYLGAFQSQFAIDPTRKHILMTVQDAQTGLIHLPNVLREMGL